MFTGIIEETGKIINITNDKLSVKAEKVLENTKIGDSIAVNGVCLTVRALGNSYFEADLSPQTFEVTSLRYLKAGNYVNLERAMPADGRFGGHIVSGHIDGTGKISSIRKNGNFYDFSVELNKSESKYTVKKGSIAINGISLTIAEIENNTVKIAVIPHTFEHTTLKELHSGDYVNVETDIFAKYVEKFLSTRDNKNEMSMEFLIENGF